jgi:MinD-like ATPase involved in chromosome partitioning or flagellar assembly
VLIAYWSVKGGSGTTVVAVTHALLVARSAPSPSPVVLVDLAGEAATVLGVRDVGSAFFGADTAELLDRATPVVDGLVLVSAGEVGPALPDDSAAPAAGEQLVATLGGLNNVVVVDCGVPAADGVAARVAAAADRSLLVVRPCFLAMRRAIAAPLRPSGVVLVTEPQRALGRSDIEAVLGVPVVAEVPHGPVIARAVDAGLLATRLPRVLDRAFRQPGVAA